MTPSIHKRIETLEAADGAGVDFILIVGLRVTPDGTAGEANQVKLLGQQFHREPAESEAAFMERLRAFARANRQPGQLGVQLLIDETYLNL